uniref:Uncharacterized protein n=1 Tax=Arundo donax TaxID=35708 RepID=A0A0A9CWB8_ARUDO
MPPISPSGISSSKPCLAAKVSSTLLMALPLSPMIRLGSLTTVLFVLSCMLPWRVLCLTSSSTRTRTLVLFGWLLKPCSAATRKAGPSSSSTSFMVSNRVISPLLSTARSKNVLPMPFATPTPLSPTVCWSSMCCVV